MNENPDVISAKRAIAVFRFLSSIPESIQQHVFNRILEDAFAQSEFFTREHALNDLCTSLSVHVFNVKDMNDVCEILFPSDVSTMVSTVIQAGDFEKLEEELPIQLPGKLNMLQAFPYFRWSGNGKLDLSNMIDSIEELIAARNRDVHAQVANDELAFEKLGYLSLMLNSLERFENGFADEKYRDIFVRWYCEGQILDVIFDTLLNCKVFSIKRWIWNYLVAECKKDKTLCEVVNERWNEFRTFNKMLAAEVSFVTIEKEEGFETAEPLGLPNDDVLNVLKLNNGFEILYNEFINMEILRRDETSLNDFKMIFSDPSETKEVKRVVFHMKYQKRTTGLLSFLWDIYRKAVELNKREFESRARRCLKIVEGTNIEEERKETERGRYNCDYKLIKEIKDILIKKCGYRKQVMKNK